MNLRLVEDIHSRRVKAVSSSGLALTAQLKRHLLTLTTPYVLFRQPRRITMSTLNISFVIATILVLFGCLEGCFGRESDGFTSVVGIDFYRPTAAEMQLVHELFTLQVSVNQSAKIFSKRSR